MFYSFVMNTPFVTQTHVKLIRGDLVSFSSGYVRHTIDENYNNRFIVRDLRRGVSYIATSTSLTVTRGEEGQRPGQQLVIKTPRNRTGYMALRDFSKEDDREDVGNFIAVLSEMQLEHDRANGVVSKLLSWTSDPVMKVILLAGVLYAMVTVFVLVAG
ncbi:hypothetical protein CHUUTOTORO_01280 [Serratia phage vB_SmaM-ChuuTotoro]|nr:hypothetical protein CHUUTOTORO_01280 [Serratia phage vB_SmaM-ChuuTotoro]